MALRPELLGSDQVSFPKMKTDCLWRAAIAVMTLSATLFAGAAETNYPSQPVRVIFPGSAGSSGDARIRMLAEKLSARLGQRFTI